MRTFLLALSMVLVACSGTTVTEAESFWCQTSAGALVDDFFAETFEEVHGTSLSAAMAEYGFKEGAGEQVGSRMTITEQRGFPDDESRDAWLASAEFAEACRVAYDAKN